MLFLLLQDDDELVMESFYHQSGNVYCCVYQGGQRFYLDSWDTQVCVCVCVCVCVSVCV